MEQENTPTRKTLWIFAVVGVLIYALVPVIWIISLSLKTPESIGDGTFLHTHWTLTTTQPRSRPASSPPRCATRSESR